MSETDSVKHEQRTSSRLAQMGLKATKVYFILLFAFLPSAYWMGWLDLKPITLNEIGDFLAGVFGPLSIFWLVLGFFQQGSELRLQVTELANSVAQQKEMVEVSRETLDHERAMVGVREAERKERARPKITAEILGISSTGNKAESSLRLRFVNIGGQLSNVVFQSKPKPLRGTLSNRPMWANGEHEDTYLEFNNGQLEKGLKVQISCADVEGDQHTVIYFAALGEGGDREFRLLPQEEESQPLAPPA